MSIDAELEKKRLQRGALDEAIIERQARLDSVTEQLDRLKTELHR